MGTEGGVKREKEGVLNHVTAAPPFNNHRCHENFVAATKHWNQRCVRFVFELKPTVDKCQTPDSGFGHSCKWLLSFFFLAVCVCVLVCMYRESPKKKPNMHYQPESFT